MSLHSSLTGSDLHETKGASSASADTLQTADGAGSTTFAKLTSGSVDTTSIFNVNKATITAYFPDIGTVSSIYVPIPFTGTITKIWTAVNTAPTTTDTIITCRNQAAASMGTITIAFSGAAAGDVDSLTPSTNNTFTAGERLTMTTDGGAANTPAANVVIEFTRTA